MQYGVPWQILAAINEIETNYGTDQSVSSAGAVGWMQFMPSTWLQYGVDALNAGYADPYNPVDAIFAAARYLRAAGAATDLRARDPRLQPLRRIRRLGAAAGQADLDLPEGRDRDADGPRRRPSAGHRASSSRGARPLRSSSRPRARPRSRGRCEPRRDAHDGRREQRRSERFHPFASRLARRGRDAAKAKSASVGARLLQLVELTSIPNAAVVAVQDGRVVQIGHSRALGTLRDPARRLRRRLHLRRARQHRAELRACQGAPYAGHLTGCRSCEQTRSRAVAGRERRQPGAADAAGQDAREEGRACQRPSRHRLATQRRRRRRSNRPRQGAPVRPPRQPRRARVRRGARGPQGAQLEDAAAPAAAPRRGRLERHGARHACACRHGAHAGHLRFAIRPAGDSGTIDPRPILANWAQLQAALHPQGAKADNALLGATASDVFLLSKAELQRAVLSDPGHHACRLRPPRHRRGRRRPARARGARLPLAQRPEADRRRAALRCGHRCHGRRARRHTTRSRSPRSTASRIAHHQGAGHDHRPHDPHAADASRANSCRTRSSA